MASSALLFIYLFAAVCGKEFFFASNGVDSGDCTNASPCQTITKVNDLLKNTSPGDSYLFRRGDEFRGQINVASAAGNKTHSIVFGAFGDSSLPIPVIKGSEKVTGTWSIYQGRIYQIEVPQTWYINNLFASSTLMTLAREPNGRESFYRTGTSPSSINITCPDLNQPTGYWNGASLRARVSPWSFSATTVVNHTKLASGGSLSVLRTFNTSGNYIGESAGWGYYLENKLDILDDAGEWFFDNATKMLYFWPPNSDSPSNYAIEATVYSYGLQTLKNYTYVSNLDFQQQWTAGIYAQYGHIGLFVDGCKFSFQELSGIWSFSYNITVQNSYFTNIYAHGMKLDYANVVNSLIFNNTIDSIGLIPGRGFSGTGGQEGISLSPRTYNVIIRANKVSRTGYTGIRFDGASHLLEYNIVDQALLTLSDGGGLYLWGSYSWLSLIRNNFVSNVYGNALWTPHPTTTIAHCLYFDDYCHHLTALNNTLFNCFSSSLYVHDSHSDIIMYNVLYNSTEFQLFFYEQFYYNITYNNTISNNYLYATTGQQKLIGKTTNFDRTDFFGNFYDNTLCAPYNINAGLFEYVAEPGRVTSTYAAYDTSTFAPDRASGNRICSFPSLPTVTPISYTTSNLLKNGNFTLGNSSWDCYPKGSPSSNCSITIGEYSFGSISTWMEISAPTSGFVPSFKTLAYNTVLFYFGTTNTSDGDSARYYEVSFAYYAPGGGSFSAVIRQSYGSYSDLSPTSSYYAAPGVVQYATVYVFAKSNDTRARIDFQIPVSFGKLYVSQASVRGVEVTPMPTNTSLLVGNPSSASKRVNLPASSYQYFDLSGNAVFSPVLGPFSSIVVVQNGTIATVPATSGTTTGSETTGQSATSASPLSSSTTGPFSAVSPISVHCSLTYLFFAFAVATAIY